MKVVKRRSIVTFEKQLDELIAGLAKEVEAVAEEQADVSRRRSSVEAKLETAREIKALMMKTAFPAVDVQTNDPDLLDESEDPGETPQRRVRVTVRPS